MYITQHFQEEALKRLAAINAQSSFNNFQPGVISADDATFDGTNELAFVRGQRAVRNPLRFGKRESVRQPLRFGKRADDQMMLVSSPQLQQDKRLSAVRNPLRFGKRADVRQPLRFGKRVVEPMDALD